MNNDLGPDRINLLGKKIAPFFARVFINNRHLAEIIRYLEAYLAFVQGKGSGAGWDLQGEVSVALSYIRRPDAVIFDVGANRGLWSALLLEALGAQQCSIFQIEPLNYCQVILSSQNLPRTTLIRAAVGETPGFATLYSPDAWSPVASLHPRRESYLQGYKFSEEKVRVTTIDEIIDQYKLDMVDFMKLDIEGHELAALHGAQESLKYRRIKALTFEFGSGNINSRTYFRDFWDMLHPYGFEIKRICPGNLLIPVERYYEDLEYFRGATNYLATIV